MTGIFADGFEAGDYSAWTSQSHTGSGALAVAPSAALVGTRGSRSSIATGTDSSDEAKTTKVFGPPVTARLYARAKIRLTTMTAVGYGVVGSKAVLAIRATDGQEQAWFSIRGGGLRFGYRAGSGAAVTVNSSIPLTVGTAVYLMALVDRAGSSPTVEGWISANGIDWMSVGTAADGSAGGQGVAKPSGQLDVGIVHIANFEPGSYAVDVDDVTVEDSLGVTDWQVLSNLLQPVNFRPRGEADKTGTSDTRHSLVASSGGSREVPALSEDLIQLSGAVSGHHDALATSSEVIVLPLAMDVLLDRRATSSTPLPLGPVTLGQHEAEADAEAAFGLTTKQHAVKGQIEEPARVRVSDRSWGSVTVMDTED